jgi:hypothetical protein
MHKSQVFSNRKKSKQLKKITMESNLIVIVCLIKKNGEHMFWRGKLNKRQRRDLIEVFWKLKVHGILYL